MLGVVAPNNSLVDPDDILYTTADSQNPSTTRPDRHDDSLLCVTDLVDCCETPMLGNWYLPDGTPVGNTGNGVFHSNRGQNEVRNGRQFYGSVRLFRRYTPLLPNPPIYHCELPNRFNVMQTLYVYIGEFLKWLFLLMFFISCAIFHIVNFGISYLHDQVTISDSGSSTVGGTYSLTCSAVLNRPISLNSSVPTPNFQWFFGPNGDASLPPGLTPMDTVLSSNTYSSTLQFSPLSQCHIGMYTCRLGAGRLVNNSMVTVNGIAMYMIVGRY